MKNRGRNNRRKIVDVYKISTPKKKLDFTNDVDEKMSTRAGEKNILNKSSEAKLEADNTLFNCFNNRASRPCSRNIEIIDLNNSDGNVNVIILPKSEKKSEKKPIYSNGSLSNKRSKLNNRLTSIGKRKNKIDSGLKTKASIVICFLSSIVLTIFVALSLKAMILPAKYLIIIISIWSLIFAFLPIAMIFKGWIKVAQVLSAIGVIGLLSVGIFENAVDYTLNKVQAGDTEDVIYAVIARRDNERLRGAGYIAGSNIAMLNNESTDLVIGNLKSEIKKRAGVDYFGNIVEKNSLYDMMNELTNDKGKDALQLACLSQSQLQIATSEIDNFNDRYKIIHIFESSIPSFKGNTEELNKGSFVVLVNVSSQYDFSNIVDTSNSGIKKYYDFKYLQGPNELSRLLVVNAATHRILIVDTPPDYYVQLFDEDDSFDKLSYSGIYGTQQSIETIERLYGVDVDYYVQTSVTNLREIIDSADVGLEIDGETTSETLDSIIDNLADVETFLPRYDGISMTISRTVRTNLPVDMIKDIISEQFADNTQWSVEHYTASGVVEERHLYSLGAANTSSSVTIPDKSSVASARRKIQALLK